MTFLTLGTLARQRGRTPRLFPEIENEQRRGLGIDGDLFEFWRRRRRHVRPLRRDIAGQYRRSAECRDSGDNRGRKRPAPDPNNPGCACVATAISCGYGAKRFMGVRACARFFGWSTGTRARF